MEPKEKVELLQKAINQLLIQEKENGKPTATTPETLIAVNDCDDDDDGNRHSLLISKLLSQLDSLGEDDMPEQPPSENTEKSATATEVVAESSGITGNEQIIKELREVKKQNSITHGLLSAMIVLTLAWQLSEVSLILRLKEGLSNPFKSIGSMIAGMFKGPAVNGQQVLNDAAAKQKEITQSYSFPGVKVPDLPHAFFSDEE